MHPPQHNINTIRRISIASRVKMLLTEHSSFSSYWKKHYKACYFKLPRRPPTRRKCFTITYQDVKLKSLVSSIDQTFWTFSTIIMGKYRGEKSNGKWGSHTTSGKSVGTQSTTPPSMCVGFETICTKTDNDAQSRTDLPCKFVVEDPSHSSSWPFTSPTNKKLFSNHGQHLSHSQHSQKFYLRDLDSGTRRIKTRKWELRALMSHSTFCNTIVSTKKTRPTLIK